MANPLPPRRAFLGGAIASLAAPGAPRAADYPTRPVRLVVGFPPGGASDIVVRLVAEGLSARLGQPFVVDNRAGAGTNIAAELVARAPADGHTLLLASVANAVNATLYQSLSFDFLRDFTPVAGLARGPLVFEAHPSAPAQTVAEFIAYAKANPGRLAIASAGNGSPGHMAIELFKMATGVSVIHVPYGGGAPALYAALAGEARAVFDNLSTSLPHVKTGALRALGVTSASRLASLPDVPSVSETVPGYEIESWFGLAAPKGTPAAVVAALGRAIDVTLAETASAARFEGLGLRALAGSAEDFGGFVAAETEKWAKVVKFSGARSD